MKKIFMQMLLIGVLILSMYLSNIALGLFIENFSAIEAFSLVFTGSFKWMIYFLIGTFGILLIISAILYITLKNTSLWGSLLGKGKDNLGTSDFSKEKDFKGITGKDGLMIGKKFRLSEKKSFEHFLLVGPTGSGKSASFFIPNLLDLPAHASVVVTDPKGELFEKTAQHALDQGKRVMVFSPFKEKSMRYNPLSLCRSSTEVRELSQILLANGNAAVEALTGTKAGGAEWTNMATPLLAAFLIFVKNLEAPHNTIDKALELIIENDLETLKILLEDAEEEAKQQFNIFLQSAESEKTASSIKTVLATNLQMFTDPMVKRITAANEIDPKALREQPTHLYVVVPEHKSDLMAPLMAPFYTQLLQFLVEDGKGAPVHFLLDEMANIGIIPGLSKTLATIRSRRVSLSLGIQSTNQLKQKYNEEANSILDNCKTKAFLPGLSYDSAEYASKMIGFKEIETVSTSFSKKSETNYSVSKQKRELLTPDEVRRLEDETVLIISDNRNPYIDKQKRYYKEQRLLDSSNKYIDIDEYIEEFLEDLREE